MSFTTQTLSSTAIAVVVLTLAFTPTSFGQEQLLQIWNSSSCTGNAAFDFSASRNVSTPNVGTLSYRQQGLWSVEFCNSTTCGNRNLLYIPVTGCQQLPGGVPSPSTFPTIVVKRFGPANQTEKNIYFFPGAQLQGDAVRVGEEGVNGINENVSSFFFSGPNEWQINSTTCYKFTAPGRMTYVNLNPPITVTSVKLGCTTTTTTTTAAPTTRPTGATGATSPTTTPPTTTTRNCTGDATCGSGLSARVDIFVAAFTFVLVAAFSLSSS